MGLKTRTDPYTFVQRGQSCHSSYGLQGIKNQLRT